MLRAVKRKLSKIKRRLLEIKLPQYCHRSGMLSSLYYAFFTSSFNRENKAVLAGKVKHINEAEEVKSNYYLLVRNTDRIEKGLLMRPRREIFAVDFIGETVDSYIGVVNKVAKENNPQIKWFTDVLLEYFKTCKPHPVIDVQRERFLKVRQDGAVSVSDCLGSVSI